MVPRLLLLLLSFTLILGGCGKTSPEPTSAAKKKQAPAPAPMPATLPATSATRNACGKNHVFKGRVKMEGTLHRTKGGQLMLQHGVLLFHQR